MDKGLLKAAVLEAKSTWKIAKQFGCAQSTVRYYLSKYGLKTKSDFYKTKFRCTCGETRRSNFPWNSRRRRSKTICKRCHSRNSVRRFREYKQKAVEYLGGKCKRCEYSKCLGSMHFHHLDPTKKDPQWRKMRNWKFEKIKNELNKCELLCANCHGEEHWDYEIGPVAQSGARLHGMQEVAGAEPARSTKPPKGIPPRIWVLAIDLFKDDAKIRQWFGRKNKALGGKTPRAVIKADGGEEIEEIFWIIASGMHT